MNILEVIREQLSPEVVAQISKTVGESPEGTKSALQNALPTLLGSAAGHAVSPNGATGLLDFLTKNAPRPGSPDSQGGSLERPDARGGAGSSFVNLLLGPKMNMVRDFIAGHSGIRSESATSLMGMGGQMLMAILGKQVMARGLGASGLGQLLSSQIPHLKGLVPPELANRLGIGNFLGIGQQSLSEAVAQVTPDVKQAGTTGARALKLAAIPVAVLLVALFFVYWHNRQANVGGTEDDTSSLQNTSAGTAMPRPDNEAFANQVRAAIASGDTVELRGATFDNSGNISADSQSKLMQLGKLINENPSTRVTLITYGSTADEAARRANTLKSGLVRMGLGPERIATQSEVGEGPPKLTFAK